VFHTLTLLDALFGLKHKVEHMRYAFATEFGLIGGTEVLEDLSANCVEARIVRLSERLLEYYLRESSL